MSPLSKSEVFFSFNDGNCQVILKLIRKCEGWNYPPKILKIKVEDVPSQISRPIIKASKMKTCGNGPKRLGDQVRVSTFWRLTHVSHRVYDQGDSAVLSRKNGISKNGLSQYPNGKKLILTLTLHHTQKSIWWEKFKTIKFLEENKDEYLYDLGTGKDSLNRIQKAPPIKEKWWIGLH